MTLKVGIVGTGWVAINRHIPAFRRDGRARVVAVVNPRIEEATTVARRLRIPHFYSSLVGMLEAESPDIVSICAPPLFHAPLVIEALDGGCHVLVEKPMAMRVFECETMVQASRKAGLNLCVNHNFLFSHSLMKVKEMQATGKLGKVLSVHALQITNLRRRLPKWYPSLPAGLFYDESPHMLYLMKFFLGDPVVERASIDDRPVGSQSISAVHATFYGEDGCRGFLTMLFNAPRDEWTLTVVTSDKLLYLDIFSDRLVMLDKGGQHTPTEVLASSLNTIAQNLWGVTVSGSRWLFRRLLYGQDLLVRRFIDSIMKHTEPPVTGEDGKRVVEILHEILYRSGASES